MPTSILDRITSENSQDKINLPIVPTEDYDKVFDLILDTYPPQAISDIILLNSLWGEKDLKELFLNESMLISINNKYPRHILTILVDNLEGDIKVKGFSFTSFAFLIEQQKMGE